MAIVCTASSATNIVTCTKQYITCLMAMLLLSATLVLVISLTSDSVWVSVIKLGKLNIRLKLWRLYITLECYKLFVYILINLHLGTFCKSLLYYNVLSQDLPMQSFLFYNIIKSDWLTKDSHLTIIYGW